jgi:hypothetical protein
MMDAGNVSPDTKGPVIARDALTGMEARLAAVLLGPRKDWNPDVAMRYLPVVSLIRERGLEDGVVELGSGALGIGPYLRRPFVGLDTGGFDGRHALIRPVEASVLATPLRDRACPCVVSVDMLEHVPAELRRLAVEEMVRVTARTLVLAVPAGADAMRHDREMAEAFRARRGVDHQFCLEHVEQGLPGKDELLVIVEEAVAASGRPATIAVHPNANLRVRSFVVRRWIRRGLVDGAAWVVLTWGANLLARCNREPAYRQMVVVDF